MKKILVFTLFLAALVGCRHLETGDVSDSRTLSSVRVSGGLHDSDLQINFSDLNRPTLLFCLIMAGSPEWEGKAVSWEVIDRVEVYRRGRDGLDKFKISKDNWGSFFVQDKDVVYVPNLF
jgi:hypothetical protein